MVNPIMACLHKGVTFKYRSQLINNIMIACSGMTFGQPGPQPWTFIAALRPIARPYTITKQSLT